MQRSLIPLAATMGLLAGCNSAPHVVTPTGAHRIPVNSEATLAAYNAQAAADEAEARRQSDTEARLQELQRQCDELKAVVLQQAAIIEHNQIKGVVSTGKQVERRPTRPKEPTPTNLSSGASYTEPGKGAVPATMPGPATMAAVPAAMTGEYPNFGGGAPAWAYWAPLPAPANSSAANDSSGLIEKRGETTVFTVTHPIVGQTAFNPPAELAASLLEAARSSEAIEIRGRTDAERITPAQRSIALARAQAARAFLVSHGVPASHIRITYLSAGDFAVDNGTPAGQARNRRVEIVVATAGNDATGSKRRM